MKKALVVLGAIFAVLLVGLAGMVGYAAYTGSRLDASSKAYVDEAIPAIARAWSKDELLKRSSPQLRELLSKDQDRLDQLFTKLSRLGALKQYQGCNGQSHTHIEASKGKTVAAEYVGHAVFEHGEASFTLRLLQTEDVWEIASFNVSSPIFLQ